MNRYRGRGEIGPLDRSSTPRTGPRQLNHVVGVMA
ncbi:hypothetical protein AB0M97_01950 [Streptomyces sp. NPDC051207]